MTPSQAELSAPKAWPPPRDRAAIAAILSYTRRTQPVRHWIHVALALIYLVLLPLATAPKDYALGLLAAYAFGRLYHTWRCYTTLLADPLTWALTAWIGWTALSMTWSADPVQGFDEFKAMRMIVTPLVLWPVIDCVTILVASLLAGVFAGNVVQALQFLHMLGLHPADNERLRGLLHPSQTGTFCAAAMCLHLAAACAWTGWKRWLSLIGLIAATAGLVATGSRAQWIAAAMAVPGAAALLMIRSAPARRLIPITIAAIIVLGAASWPWIGGYVRDRIEAAVHEFEAGERAGTVSTSTQLRIASWEWAWSLFREAPVRGIGVGSYPTAVQKTPGYLAAIAHEPDRERYLTRAHPHSVYLYTLCCTGLVGAALLLGVLGITAARAWRIRTDFAYAPAVFFVLLVWLIGAVFDCFTINGNSLGLLAFFMTLVQPLRPPRDSSERAGTLSAA